MMKCNKNLKTNNRWLYVCADVKDDDGSEF